MQTSTDFSRSAQHIVVPLGANALTAPALEADAIVSHISLRWRSVPMLSNLRARAGTRPLIHVEHGYTESFVRHEINATGRFLSLLRLGYALFDTVVAVSGAQGGWLLQAGLISPTQLTVLRPCTDLTPFLALEAPSGPVKTIGVLGRLHRQKGLETLIDAWRTCEGKGRRLRFFGDGPDRPALEARAVGLQGVSFEGVAVDPASALAHCDAVAVPSRWEPFGIAALEARAAGRLLLVTPADGLADHAAAGAIAVAPSAEEAGAGAWARALSKVLDRPAPHAAIAVPRRMAALATAREFASGWADLVDRLVARPVDARRAAA